MNKIYLIILFLTLLTACKSNFDKALWNTEEDDNNWPYRDAMLDDLTKNHKIKGLSYKQIVDSIGPPNFNGDEANRFYYRIKEDYGLDIDPVYTKTLLIQLNKDSIVTDFKVDEFKH